MFIHHSQLRHLWPLCFPGWDIAMDQRVCVTHTELTVGTCRVPYLATTRFTLLPRVLFDFFMNSTFEEK